jgi:hypothetical protein
MVSQYAGSSTGTHAKAFPRTLASRLGASSWLPITPDDEEYDIVLVLSNSEREVYATLAKPGYFRHKALRMYMHTAFPSRVTLRADSAPQQYCSRTVVQFIVMRKASGTSRHGRPGDVE